MQTIDPIRVLLTIGIVSRRPATDTGDPGSARDGGVVDTGLATVHMFA